MGVQPVWIQHCGAINIITVSAADQVHWRTRINAEHHANSVSPLVRDYLMFLAAEPGNVSDVDSHRPAQIGLFRRLDQQGQGLSPADRHPRSRLFERLV